MSGQPPKVFLSYSHDSTEHEERALGLSQRLREDGIESWIDQYENGTPEEGWPRWMLNRLDWADFVLVVCSETYYQRFRGKEEPGKGKGADWEGQLVTVEMYNSKSRAVKFVPVLFEEQDAQFIPEPLRATTHYLLDPEHPSSFAHYTKLRTFLHGKADVSPKSLGLPKGIERRDVESLTFAREGASEVRNAILTQGLGVAPHSNCLESLSPRQPPETAAVCKDVEEYLRSLSHCQSILQDGNELFVSWRAPRVRRRAREGNPRSSF